VPPTESCRSLSETAPPATKACATSTRRFVSPHSVCSCGASHAKPAS
jgi:hypothetical protein